MDNAVKKIPEHASSGDVEEELTTYPGDLYVKNVHKTFGVTKALNDVSFRGHFGEIHAIIGGNGSGKSTLAKVLAGVLPIDSGQVSIKGYHPNTPGESRAIGVAMVFQEVLVADESSVVDNLFVGSDSFFSKSMSDKKKQEKARTMMSELVGEPVDPLVPVGTLPLSVKAWITIARGLLCEPDLLILDESSAALDFDSTERLFNKIRELRDRGSAIIIVTHRIAELIRISDRCTVMRDGKDVGVLEKEEITEENLLRLMTGKAQSEKPKVGGAHKTVSREVAVKTRDMQIWPDADPVDFDLFKGEIVGVTGLDGHGQDDFCRILAGIKEAGDGHPMVRKKNSDNYFTIRSLGDAQNHDIAFVSGDRKREGILPNLSIFENLLFPLYSSHITLPGVRLIDWSSLKDVFSWEVKRLAIKTGPKENLITSLSGGNQQKVMLGRAFTTHPSTLVLLDPARGVDLHTKRDLYQLLRKSASEGSSVIYMSSELEEFIGFCSRVLVFRNGSVFEEFIDEEVEPVGILESMFGRYQGKDGSHQSAMERKKREAIGGSKRTNTNKAASKQKDQTEKQSVIKQAISGQQSVKSESKSEPRADIETSREINSEFNVSKFNVSNYFKDKPLTLSSGTGNYSSSDEDLFEKLIASNEVEEDLLGLRGDNKLKEKPVPRDLHYSDKDTRNFEKLIAFENGSKSVRRTAVSRGDKSGYSDTDERGFKELMQFGQERTSKNNFISTDTNNMKKSTDYKEKPGKAITNTVEYSEQDLQEFSKLLPDKK